MRGLKMGIWTAALAASVLFSGRALCADDAPTPKKKDSEKVAPSACSDLAQEHCDWDEQHPACIEVFAEALFLNLKGADVLFAQARNGCGTMAAPAGPAGGITSGYAPGGRIGANVYLSACSMVETHFTWWQTDDSATVAAPNGFTLQSLITLPSFQNCSDTQTASATSRLTMESADVAYVHLLCGEQGCCALSWLVGARYAHLKESFNAMFSISGPTTVTTSIDFDGGGPRIGLDGEVQLKCGFSLYGRATADFLAGHFGAAFSQVNTFAGVQGISGFKSDRIVPVLELQLGLGWTSPKGHIYVRAGYEVDAWFNTVTTPDFITAVQNNNFTTNGNNLKDCITFDGVTARVELRF
jgi:hypothetical protein